MDILDIKEVNSALVNEIAKFNEIKIDELQINRCLLEIEKVDEWQYSRHQFFHPVPLEAELSGQAKGMLIKKKYPTYREGARAGMYCFGFISGVHTITVSPVSNDNSPMTVSFIKHENGQVFIINSIHYRRADKPSQLIGISNFLPISDTERINVGVGGRGSFYIYLYEYGKNGLVEHVHAISKGWPKQVDYSLKYDANDTLISISIGRTIIWPKNG